MNNVQWRKVKLEEVAKTFTGLTYSPNCIDKSGTLVLRSSNIKDGQLCFEDNVFVSMDIPERAIVQENDILICVRNGSRNLIGKCALITKDAVGMAFGAFMTVLRTNIIDPKLLLYIWQSNNIQRQVANNIGATINQITNADFNRFEISYPESLPAQRRIAAILTSADKVIAATQKTIAKYKQIKQGMMEDLLKPKEGWKMVKLGEVYNFQYGDGNKNPNNNGDYPIYGANGIIGGYTKFNAVDSVVIGHMGEYAGSVIWANGKHFVTYNGTITIVKDNNSLYDRFGYFVLLNLDIKKICAGSGQPFLSYDTLNKIEISIPDLPAQRRIATILSGIDAKIAAEEKVLEKYEKVKKGLMEKLLNSKN